jgi:hypothetical protein
MNNDPNPQQWEQPQPPTQYETQQPWAQPQWQQPPNQYPSQQYAPGQYNQYQYSNVPPYAQPQVQQQQTNNFIMRFLMMGIAIRIVLLILVPLLLCGGCAMVVFLASLAHP